MEKERIGNICMTKSVEIMEKREQGIEKINEEVMETAKNEEKDQNTKDKGRKCRD